MEKKWLAIIGTREPSDRQIAAVKKIIAELDGNQWAVISGCAEGIDRLALETAYARGIETIGCLPWPAYNRHVQMHCNQTFDIDQLEFEERQLAYASVDDFHPAPKNLTQGARKLHARNYGIIRWADSVLALPSTKFGGGGTGQGIRLAQAMRKPINIVTE